MLYAENATPNAVHVPLSLGGVMVAHLHPQRGPELPVVVAATEVDRHEISQCLVKYPGVLLPQEALVGRVSHIIEQGSPWRFLFYATQTRADCYPRGLLEFTVIFALKAGGVGSNDAVVGNSATPTAANGRGDPCWSTMSAAGANTDAAATTPTAAAAFLAGRRGMGGGGGYAAGDIGLLAAVAGHANSKDGNQNVPGRGVNTTGLGMMGPRGDAGNMPASSTTTTAAAASLALRVSVHRPGDIVGAESTERSLARWHTPLVSTVHKFLRAEQRYRYVSQSFAYMDAVRAHDRAVQRLTQRLEDDVLSCGGGIARGAAAPPIATSHPPHLTRTLLCAIQAPLCSHQPRAVAVMVRQVGRTMVARTRVMPYEVCPRHRRAAPASSIQTRVSTAPQRPSDRVRSLSMSSAASSRAFRTAAARATLATAM
jgi:hypothetical protein